MRAVVKCPESGKDFEIDIPSTAKDVELYWRKTIETSCPHCGASHLAGFRQLYVAAVMGRHDWEDVLSAPPGPRQHAHSLLR